MGRILVAGLVWLLAASPAAAQEDRSVLLILDSSKSMDEPAGGGGTRLDAAKAATREMLAAVPEDAKVGLRVYGAKIAGATRARGCRDTELAVPVGAIRRDQVARVVDGLQGKGRTPIGRSLLAAPGDFTAPGRRTVILVSDGGDNCAPPDPCKAAERVARRGIDMTIQVVGLQVDERVRRQLRCIAEAGGGSYVDAQDGDQLKAELAAAFARAYRRYEPTGRPVEGGPTQESAVAVRPGQYLDSIGPDTSRWYAVEVKRGQRLFAAATLVGEPPPAPRLSALVTVEMRDPAGEWFMHDTANFRTTGGRTPIGTFAAAMDEPAAADGTYRFGVRVEADAVGFERPLPVEVILSAGGDDAAAAPAPRAGSGKSSPRKVVSSDVPELAGIGGAGLLLGLGAGLIARRRRT